jgi:hypothetical protein
MIDMKEYTVHDVEVQKVDERGARIPDYITMKHHHWSGVGYMSYDIHWNKRYVVLTRGFGKAEFFPDGNTYRIYGDIVKFAPFRKGLAARWMERYQFGVGASKTRYDPLEDE